VFFDRIFLLLDCFFDRDLLNNLMIVKGRSRKVTKA
jgi:hypothetical protein